RQRRATIAGRDRVGGDRGRRLRRAPVRARTAGVLTPAAIQLNRKFDFPRRSLLLSIDRRFNPLDFENNFQYWSAMSRRLLPALVLLIAGCAPSAPDPDQPLTAEEVAPVAEQYATLVAANYADAHASALELRDAIANFVAAPGEAGLEAARLA